MGLMETRITIRKMEYKDFLKQKTQLSGNFGFDPILMPDFLFDFQKYLTEWSLKKGRGAIFSDTGTGKTIMELVWAQNIVQKTNKNVILFAPLAVSEQTIKEGKRFGIEVKRSRDGKPKGKITITNYEQISKFNKNDYIGCVLDESSAIKNSIGKTKKLVVMFMNKMPYRSLWTATPSPNDYIELGTSSEAIGELPYMEMLDQFFRDTSNDKNPQWSRPKYELKKHGENIFWKWVAGWSRALRKPSDYGFEDNGFILPELIECDHILKVTKPPPGQLFIKAAKTLREQREERKMTIKERGEKVKSLLNGYDFNVIWGHYNYETDYLEKIIPDAVQVSGRDTLERKEDKLIDFSNGNIQTLITKPKMGAWGLNWQHCNHAIFFPSHSYEQYYQAVRRFYRFGQERKVYIDMVTTEGEAIVYKNVKRKAKQADEMFTQLVKYMNDYHEIKAKVHNNYKINLPQWI